MVNVGPHKQRIRSHIRSRARLPGDEGVRDDNSTPATGSYNGNQDKDNYQCPTPSLPSLSLSILCLPPSFANILVIPLLLPLPFGSHLTSLLYFISLLNLAVLVEISRLDYPRVKADTSNDFPVVSRNEWENYTEHPLGETISPSLFD